LLPKTLANTGYLLLLASMPLPLVAKADTVTDATQVFGLGTVRSVAYSPDGTKILLGAAANAQLFDSKVALKNNLNNSI